jgi:hypothetical protein
MYNIIIKMTSKISYIPVYNYIIKIKVFDDIDDKTNITMEHAVMKAARKCMIQGTSIRPMLSGFSGGMDKPYFDSSLGFLDQNLPCWVSQ